MMDEWKCDVCLGGLDSIVQTSTGNIHICLGCRPEDFEIIPAWVVKAFATISDRHDD